jgi:hypothetical protein
MGGSGGRTIARPTVATMTVGARRLPSWMPGTNGRFSPWIARFKAAEPVAESGNRAANQFIARTDGRYVT